MAVSAHYYGNFFVHLAEKRIDFNSDAIKVALCTSAYTPNQDTDDFFDDVTNEVTGTGYTAGGLTLTGASVAYNGGTNVMTFDADNATWPGSTITAHYAVVYDSTPGTAATNPLILYVDFDADISSTAGDFTITWDAAGLATVTVA